MNSNKKLKIHVFFKYQALSIARKIYFQKTAFEKEKVGMAYQIYHFNLVLFSSI